MAATHDIPRPMRAKNVLVKDDPAGQKKNWDIIQKHLDKDGYLLQQPKIDGMRILFDDGIARSRSWTPWTNRYLQAFAKDHADLIHGWDCEGLPGLHTVEHPDPEVFRRAMSGLRSEDGSNEMTLFLFDNWDKSWKHRRYEDRFKALELDLDYLPKNIFGTEVEKFMPLGTMLHYRVRIILCPTIVVKSIEEILENHLLNVANGWEGSMLRRAGSPYKWNVSTLLEGYLAKIKDVEDAEAVIYGFEPAYANENEAVVSPLGYTKRSAHLANLVPKDYLGAWLVHRLDNPSVTFKVGVLKGYSIADRRALLKLAEEGKMNGKILKFEHQGYGGGYDKPRAPVGVSLRDPIDL